MSIAFLFPGQGSQYVGMGADLYARAPAARNLFDEADALVGQALSALCFHGPEDALTDTVNQQPALFVTSVAAWRAALATGWGTPAYVAGHSLGEFAALVAAGSLDFEAGLALVQRRGELMKQAGEQSPGGMAAVLGLEAGVVSAVCEEAARATGRPLQLANDNCPGQHVISGDTAALAAAEPLLREAGARRIVPLAITIAAHSPLMASVAEEFAQAVDDTPLHPPRVPIIGNTTARPLRSVDAIRAELKAQLTSTVQWTPSMVYLRSQGVETFVELGAGSVLCNLMKRIDRQAERVAFEPGLAPAGGAP